MTLALGGNQANAIYLEMERLGFAVWYDNRASDLTKEGMREGIVQAAAFLLFLSDGVLERPFCESFSPYVCVNSAWQCACYNTKTCWI
jgi:hypothetical protein